MRVLVIASDIVPDRLGGAEAHLVEVLKRLAPKLEKAIVVVGRDDLVKGLFRKFPQISFVKINYPRIPNLYGVAYILFAAPVALFLAVRNRSNLIWASQEFPQAQVGAIVQVFTGIPFYVTSQNPRLHREELVLKGRLLGRMDGFLTGLLDPVIRFGLGAADCVGAVSKYSARKANEMGARRVLVIPNGVDLSTFRRPKKEKGKILKIITVSSLIPRNGIDTLIEACRNLPSGIKWELIVAGDGPLRERLVRMGGRKVRFLGRVENSLVPGLLAKSDIFVRPSRFEGFGSAFLEAMAAGVPVIGTSIGGITDFITDKETGLLVSVDDPRGLASKIVALWRDSQLYEKLKINGLKLVKGKYDWDLVAERVWKVFRQIT